MDAGGNMKRKDFYIGLNGLILVYLVIIWCGSGYMINDFLTQFISRYYVVILWAIGN